MVNAVIYVRLASDCHNDDPIENQIRAVEDYAKKNGFNIVDTYTDRVMTTISDKQL